MPRHLVGSRLGNDILKDAVLLFNRIDFNRNGYVTVNEFEQYIKQLEPAMSGMHLDELLISFVDRDSDGRISLEEFVAHYKEIKDTFDVLARASEEKFHLTKAERKRLERMFHIMDTNKDYTLSLEEVRKEMKHCGLQEDEAEIVFKAMDKNGDGIVTRDEFVTNSRVLFDHELRKKALVAQQKQRSGIAKNSRVGIDLTQDQVSEAYAIYRCFDLNNDGRVTSTEFSSKLNDFGFSEEEVIKIMADIDTDDNDHVSFAEFLQSYVTFLDFS
eukprot:Rmarinus@m.10501